MVNDVQCYDPVTDEWKKTFPLPHALGGIRACTLTVLPNFANQRNSNNTADSNGGSSQSNSNSSPAQLQDGSGNRLCGLRWLFRISLYKFSTLRKIQELLGVLFVDTGTLIPNLWVFRFRILCHKIF